MLFNFSSCILRGSFCVMSSLLSDINSFELTWLILVFCLRSLLIGGVIIVIFRGVPIVSNDIPRLLLQPLFLVLGLFLSLFGSYCNKIVLLICVVAIIVERVFDDIRIVPSINVVLI